MGLFVRLRTSLFHFAISGPARALNVEFRNRRMHLTPVTTIYGEILDSRVTTYCIKGSDLHTPIS